MQSRGKNYELWMKATVASHGETRFTLDMILELGYAAVIHFTRAVRM
jgi:hypothetical protein